MERKWRHITKKEAIAMQRFIRHFALSLILAVFLIGCATVHSPVSGFLFTNVDAPVAATSNPSYTKVGSATCFSFLGIIAAGSCSIETATTKGKILKIHHVDAESFSLLGIFATYKVKVYGE